MNNNIEYTQYHSTMHHYIQLVLEQSEGIRTCKGIQPSACQRWPFFLAVTASSCFCCFFFCFFRLTLWHCEKLISKWIFNSPLTLPLRHLLRLSDRLPSPLPASHCLSGHLPKKLRSTSSICNLTGWLGQGKGSFGCCIQLTGCKSSCRTAEEHFEYL